MFLEARDIGYIRRIPSRKINIVGQVAEHKSATTMSLNDLKTLKRYLTDNEPDSNANLFTLTQVYTGARYSEVAGLQWSDIDFDNQQIIVDEAYDEKEKKLKEPKSKAGNRRIDVDINLLKLLRRHKVTQAKLIIANKLRNPQNFIFVNNKDGFPISNSFVNRYIRESCEKSEIARISSHTLRHARTDFLILSGADPLYVKDQLGHEDIETTLKHYTSLSVELRTKSRDAVRQLEKQLL